MWLSAAFVPFYAIKLFTLTFGGDTHTEVLHQMAESNCGKIYSGDPATSSQVYAEIALFSKLHSLEYTLCSPGFSLELSGLSF